MATEPFALGTDAGEKLRENLRSFLKSWLANPAYKSRLPAKKHLTILEQGEREGAGITIRVVSEDDPQGPWPYKDKVTGRMVVEDRHMVAIFVKADRSAGGAQSISAVYGALRALFASRDNMPERTALIEAGIHNCTETPEGIVVNPGDNDEEGTFFKQQINLRCNTDTFLN
jgi:hypothetical protein